MNTESRNPRSIGIDLFPTGRILKIINGEDARVARAVSYAIEDIARVVDAAVNAINLGGRVIYIGAGTSGRLAILDAAECAPTFSTPREWFQAILAGGRSAFAVAREGAEDDRAKAISDLKSKKIEPRDLVIGVAASGDTPYTVTALEFAASKGARTAAIVCTRRTPIAEVAELSIFVDVGPEIIAGSSRMKAGTAQKMILNMISTATMIRLGMTYSNWMINVAMTNQKLRARGVHILEEILDISHDRAEQLVELAGGKLKVAVTMGALGCDRTEAERRLTEANGNLRAVLGCRGGVRE